MKSISGYLFVLLAVLTANFALALPFNDDMANTSALRTGSIVRTKPPETVPVGSLKRRVESKEAALLLTNPNGNKDPLAISNGDRLFASNCSPCHGRFNDIGVDAGLVAQKSIMAGPDLGSDYYAEKPDGLFYGTIHFGGMAVMPRVGFKLSPSETWDIVSYIRSVQTSRKK
ncbi:MAG: c-type cytochrome [bacterium]|nr:c-type cytochrome [bacterium]